MKRIRDTSERVPKLDAEKIARGLGADNSVKFDAEGNLAITIYKKQKTIKRIIRKLSGEEIGGFVFLCETEGHDFFHCLYTAGQCCKKFAKRVAGFRILPPTTEGMKEGMKIRVEFYEKKK